MFILDSLADYDTKDPSDAEKIVERVLPRLQHVNSAVVLSAVKVRVACACAEDTSAFCIPHFLYAAEVPFAKSSVLLTGHLEDDECGS